MAKYIPLNSVVMEINRQIELLKPYLGDCAEQILAEANAKLSVLEGLKNFLETLEVKIDENHLEKFKSLQHISRDLHQTLEDWGYAPNLYFFDGMWHVSWISCEEGDSIKDFEGNTPEEAIDKACNWFHSTFCNS